MARPKLWRIVQFAAGALLVGLAIRSIAANWQSLRAQRIDWQLSPGLIVASMLVVFTAYAVLVEAWRRVVLSMGQRLPFFSAVRIWFLASLGKYIPGKVWAVAGAAVLARRAGVDPSVAVAGALVLHALALASGAAAVALTARDALQALGPAAVPIAAVLLGLSAVGLAALASQSWLDRISRLLPSSFPRLRAVGFGILSLAFAANLLAWALYGSALLLLTRGVLPEVTLSLPQAIGVFTCSYLAGFVALFAPGGLGPRESVFLLMLAGDIGLKPAAGLALASRLLLTGTEVLPAVPLLLLRRDATSPPSVR
ncbi:MAG TPA: lysylphosphatidylglycerol synthase domain-containing protein, partial [Gemmatimonadales bacterium]|nr:lysylphosphatidylglycerol synthase domain-containing protein [Gemmatimonadales bacterium]